MITLLTGNGRILLSLNADGEWGELFYPYPGQFQHLRETRVGLFEVERRRFSWLRSPSMFRAEQTFPEHANIPETRWEGDGIQIRAGDFVHPNHDLVVRVFRVRAQPAREIRLFVYHSFKIAESMYQDTAYVDPEQHSLVHYKRGFYFEFFSRPTFDNAACGEHTLKGLQGTYVDAEDGTLQGRTISHGAADSVLQWNLKAGPDHDTVVRLFVAVGQGVDATRRLREYVRNGDYSRFEREAQAFWRNWVARHPPQTGPGLSERARALYQSSVFVMRNNAAQTGSIIASPDTSTLTSSGDTYNYCWWRDGGYISKAMDEADLYENAHRFLQFAMRCQSPEGYFVHRHFPDGAIGSTWHPPPFLQLDQTGTVIAAVWHHFKARSDLDSLLDFWPMVKAGANFLATYRDPETGLPGASFDLWEERKAIHTYSTAVAVHALERAARIAQELGKDPSRWRAASLEIHEAALRHLWNAPRGRLLRSFGPVDETLDASALLALKHGFLAWTDPRARRIVDDIEKRLWKAPVGGIARYEGDTYFGPENPWIICTLWLAEARLNLGDAERCRELLEWVAAKATPTLLLPEQLDAQSGGPRSATPLVWSHSTFVDVVHKYRRLRAGLGSGEE